MKLDLSERSAYLQLIEDRFGLRLTDHQARNSDEIISRKLEASGYADPATLYSAFAAGYRLDLLEALAAELTIGETHFFRVGPQIEALRRVVLPDLIGRRSAERRVRLWSAGCSTGEEPYTLAMLLREHLPAPDSWDIRLIATDINPQVLAQARDGLYGNWSFRDTPQEVRERYFSPEGRRWRLVEPIRRMVHFDLLNLAAGSWQPLARDAGQLDLILCRNVTIYFSPQATQQVYRRFGEVLADPGWLILGPSDPAPDPSLGLKAVYLPGAVLWRRSSADRAPTVASRSNRVNSKSQPSVTPRVTADRRTARMPAATATQATNELPLEIQHVRALAHGGDHDEARKQAERLAQARPLDAEAHLLLGMLRLDAGDVEVAVEALRRAAFLDARNPLVHFTLGRAYLLLGDRVRGQAALSYARRILALAPDDDVIPGSSGLLAGELRQTVELQLASPFTRTRNP